MLGSALCLGLGSGALIAPWIPEALQELGSSPALSVAGLAIVCVWVAPFELVALAALERLTARQPTGARALAVGAGVFAAEWTLSTAWWGVPWCLLGYSQRGWAGVAQLAAVGGVPLISAWLVATQVALVDLWARGQGAARLATALVAGWGALALAGLAVAEAVRPVSAEDTSYELLVVQPDLPRGERWAEDLQTLNLHRIRTFVDRVVGADSRAFDALLLPENLLTVPLDATPELAEALEAWLRDLGRPVLSGLVLSAEASDPRLYRSATVWLEPGQGITGRVDKERAIPLLESGSRFPGDRWLAPLFGNAVRWKKVEESGRSETLRGPVPLAPALCYEVLFPGLVARRRTADSAALVNLADDSWVQGEAATRHLVAIASFRAIEQRLPLLRVAHGGLSVLIDPFGRAVEELPLDRYASMRVTLPPSPPPTLGERIAISMLPIGAFLVVWWLWPAAAAARRRAAAAPAAGGDL